MAERVGLFIIAASRAYLAGVHAAIDKQLVEMLCIDGKKINVIHHGAFEAQVFLLYYEITSNELGRSIVPSSVPQCALKCRALHSNCFANLNIRSLCLPQCQ